MIYISGMDWMDTSISILQDVCLKPWISVSVTKNHMLTSLQQEIQTGFQHMPIY